MGRYTGQAKTLLEEKTKDGTKVNDAIHAIQTRCQQKVKEREATIKEVQEWFQGKLPVEWRAVLANEEHMIALEKEWSAEFDQFKE